MSSVILQRYNSEQLAKLPSNVRFSFSYKVLSNNFNLLTIAKPESRAEVLLVALSLARLK